MFFKSGIWVWARVAVLLMALPATGVAEKVKPLNPNCNVCPVVISYEGDEARDILGPTGLQLMSKLKAMGIKTIKIDLDGVKKLGTAQSEDEGYELVVFNYKHMVLIQSVIDGSLLEIKTSSGEPKSGAVADAPAPEIHLRSGKNIPLKKKDDLSAAWEKMKKSYLYKNITSGLQDNARDAWNKTLVK